jgi:regulatory protein
MKPKTEAELLNIAAAYCAASEHCIRDVREKLARAGAESTVQQQIIDRLLKEQFVDEKRFCQSFVKDKFKFNHWGRIKIRFELQKKCIPNDIINDALDCIDENTYQTALLQLLNDKKRTTKCQNEREMFVKLYRFACGRGFESNIVSSCLSKLFKTNYEVGDIDLE